MLSKEALPRMSGPKLATMKFEVFGTVKGVFYRAHAFREAERLGLVGYIKHSPKNTVIGELQGLVPKLAIMKEWLRKRGSPDSRVEKVIFSDEQQIQTLSYEHLRIIRS
ncbi:acylphosphatase-1-like [Cimex lectularius]|uniref:acylphosphatase n=1 Tax=Cimex lectularius TaxID=79782 RepID=A0A8I6S8P0_CIMLE|nr:acylphosphatase-1-like [Cimex lectularius]